MISQRAISSLSVRAGLFEQASRIFGSRSCRPFTGNLCPFKNSDQYPKSLSQIPQSSNGFSGCLEILKGKTLFTKLGFMNVKENVSPTCAMSFRSSIHSASPKEVDTGRNSRSMDFVRGIIEENGKNLMGSSQFSRYSVEQNADIVHVKMLRNNTFVTITDSKGRKKVGASSGCLAEMKGGPKASRYAAEATAEHVGRLARNMGLKSVVVKLNGFTYFKKKKQAILSFRDGYTHSRGDQNPIVYIEDTTRRPHNGCRLRKQRRV